ncbi:MAG: BTAD domain-containing putative transcriptional regulator [Ilumatobacter sp.]|uniref:AfsR/SARP family transcriptional regulator n=1 Tax=Ilumatobacter sp. TaxID=1967498 RepID=UPI003918910C
MTGGEPTVVKIGVLGVLTATRGGEPLELGGPKSQAVLLALAHNLDDVVRVDTISEILWGDRPPKSARNAIQVKVSQLRSALGPGCEIRTAATGYTLCSDGVTVDAAEFERLVGVAEGTVEADPSAAAEASRAALALWRGAPMAEELELEPLRGQIVGLKELRVRAQVLVLDARLRLGQHRECCAGAELLAEEHPYREDIRALHMLALYRSSRQTESLAVYRQTRQLLVEELGIDPGPELSALHRQILDQDPALDAPSARAAPGPLVDASLVTDNLRSEPNLFVDRPEVEAIAASIGAGRVVTAVGTGGIGKSRCVGAVARRCLGGAVAADGVWVVDLAPLPDESDEVAAAVADAMGLGQEPDTTSTATIASYLAYRSTLVVLDNCEHVAEGARRFVEDLGAGAPSTAILAASRVRLGLANESVVVLDRLPDPAAHELLDARIAEVGAGPFADQERDELCAVLDNYPLAIELAAARTRALSPREIARRLADQPGLLASAAPTRAAGGSRSHADLATTLEWSLERLSPASRKTLIRATVFVSDFDLRGAEAVLSTDDTSAADVVAHLGELVEHHLVSRDHGRARFRILEPIRQHLHVRTSSSTQQHYIEHFSTLAIDGAVGLCGPDEAKWWDRVHRELPHVREVVRLATERADIELLDRVMGPMAVAVSILGFVAPGDWAVDALRRLELAPADAPGVAAAAAAHFAHLDQIEECDAVLDSLDASVDDPWMRAVVYCVRLFRDPSGEQWGPLVKAAAEECGDPALLVLGKFRARDSDGVEAADEYGNPTLRVYARQMRSAMMADALSDAARRNREALYRIALTSNNQHTIAEGQMFMALQHCYDGDPRQAGPLAVEMIERMVRVRSPHWVWHGVEVIGVMLAMLRMESYTSERLWAAVSSSGRPPFARLTRNPELPAWVASQLSDEQRRQAFDDGSGLTMDVAAIEARKAAERIAAG